MFGYVKTDLPNLYVKDTVLYKATYCGLCKGIGKCCGQKGRLVLSYDLTFLSVFLHNVMGIDVNIKREHCVLHRVKKRPVAEYDALTGRIACLNVILSYYKLTDDVIDNNRGRGKRAFFISSYKKAKKLEPKLDEIVKKSYDKLLELEKQQSSSIDFISDPFGNMLLEVVKELTGDKYSEELGRLAYNLGKWIYLIDAIDDFDKDKKKNRYNVFINAHTDANNKDELIRKYGNEIIFVFYTVLESIASDTKAIKYNFNHDLTDNILLNGLRETFKQVMENKKCKNTTKF